MTALNLLQQSSLPLTRIPPTSLLLLALVVLLGLMHGWQARREARLTQALHRLQEQSQELARRTDTARQRAHTRAELSARHGLIVKLERRRGLARQRLLAVAGELADGTWLVEMSQSPTQTSLRGVSHSAEEISAFLARLEANPELGHLQLLDVSRASGDGPPYAPSFTFTARTLRAEGTPDSVEKAGRQATPSDPSA